LSASRISVGDEWYPEPPGAEELVPVAAGEVGRIVRGITLRTGAETGVAVVLHQADRLMRVLSVCGVATAGDRSPISPLVRVGFVDRVLESGRTTGEPIDPDPDPSLGLAASGARLTFAVGAGIHPPGGPRGALCVGFSSRPADEALALWQVESYARVASLCLHEEGRHDGLMAAARLDGLTGCLNYVAVRAELDREIQRSERHGRSMSCCFIDLDHFKQVNDRYGHPYGNQVLAGVAAVLRDGVRIGDTIGRYGGDEFLAILPDANEAEACVLGERLRSKIFATMPRGTSEQSGTSIGVAQWRPGYTADQMLLAADAALLRAKDSGGGIVVGAGGAMAGARPGAIGGHSGAL